MPFVGQSRIRSNFSVRVNRKLFFFSTTQNQVVIPTINTNLRVLPFVFQVKRAKSLLTCKHVAPARNVVYWTKSYNRTPEANRYHKKRSLLMHPHAVSHEFVYGHQTSESDCLTKEGKIWWAKLMNCALSKLFPCLGVAPSFLRLVLIILVTQRFDNFDGLRRER